MAVTVTRGKTHTRHCRILFDGANLSGDARTLDNVGVTYEEADATGWNAALMESLHGQGTISFGPFNAMLNQRAAATGPIEPGVHTALSGIGTPLATLAIGIQEAPTIGAPAFSMATRQGSYVATAVTNDLVTIAANFTTRADSTAVAGVWGQLLAVGASVSSTTNNGSLDNGASSSGGYLAFLHITTSAGAMGSNNWAVTIEHSTNDSAWATLHTFSANGSTATAERGTNTGTVNRYVRAVATKTGGTDLIYWVNFIRL